MKRLVTGGRLARPVVNRFVAGTRLDDAVRGIKRLNAAGIGGILDLLGEGVVDPAGAEAAAEEYLESITCIRETGIDTTVSVKLTQLGLAFDKGACIDHLRRLCAEAAAVRVHLEIDMEQSLYAGDTIDVFRVLQTDFPDLRLAVQAYMRRTPVDLESMAHIRPRIRLVKGAYAEAEDVAFQKGAEIDGQYRFLTRWLLEKGTDPAFGTHDGRLIRQVVQTAHAFGMSKQGFEFQMLYGIRRDLQEKLARDGYKVRTYVPFGAAWYPYLMRRIAERPANLRFFLRAMLRN